MKVIECSDAEVKGFICRFLGMYPESAQNLSIIDGPSCDANVIERLVFIGEAESTIEATVRTIITNIDRKRCS